MATLPPLPPSSRPACIAPAIVAVRPAAYRHHIEKSDTRPLRRPNLAQRLRILARGPRALLIKAKAGDR